MATLKDIRSVAKKIGAKVSDTKAFGKHVCEVEAPHRHVWMCAGIHMLADETNQPWKPDYADLLDRMEYGIEPCVDPDCDWCNDEAAK